MQLICPKCLQIGKGKYSTLDDFRLPIAGFFIGFAFFWISVESFSISQMNFRTVFDLVCSIVFFSIGAYLIISHYLKNRDLCPKCNYGHMVETNTTDSIPLIQKDNLNI